MFWMGTRSISWSSINWSGKPLDSTLLKSHNSISHVLDFYVFAKASTCSTIEILKMKFLKIKIKNLVEWNCCWLPWKRSREQKHQQIQISWQPQISTTSRAPVAGENSLHAQEYTLYLLLSSVSVAFQNMPQKVSINSDQSCKWLKMLLPHLGQHSHITSACPFSATGSNNDGTPSTACCVEEQYKIARSASWLCQHRLEGNLVEFYLKRTR